VDLELAGKVAIVTGSSRGIGRAIALGLGREGCRVALNARGADRLEQTASDLSELGTETLAIASDVTTSEGIARLIDETLGRWGRVDVLVNNVGGGAGATFEDTKDEDWERATQLTLFSSIRASRAVLPAMERQGGGSIIMISSVFGREWGGRPAYQVVKSAQISLVKSMARELAPRGIRVNSVAPGSILFPGGSWARRQAEDPQGIADFVRQEIPSGRFGRPEEVADVVVFLASERSRWVTGACLNVDGGQSRSLI
jgi:3-oxoacyl-[acyl-carrier protein] reductase